MQRWPRDDIIYVRPCPVCFFFLHACCRDCKIHPSIQIGGIWSSSCLSLSPEREKYVGWATGNAGGHDSEVRGLFTRWRIHISYYMSHWWLELIQVGYPFLFDVFGYSLDYFLHIYFCTTFCTIVWLYYVYYLHVALHQFLYISV